MHNLQPTRLAAVSKALSLNVTFHSHIFPTHCSPTPTPSIPQEKEIRLVPVLNRQHKTEMLLSFDASQPPALGQPNTSLPYPTQPNPTLSRFLVLGPSCSTIVIMPFLVTKEAASKQKGGDATAVEKNSRPVRVYSNDIVSLGGLCF